MLIDRDDKQNWRAGQRLSFQRVQDCFQAIQDQDHMLAAGTKTYPKIVWFYSETFCSPIADLNTRIKCAAIVCHFLGIWRTWIGQQRHLKLNTNFISRETYQDVLLSCHFAVMLICYLRDQFSHLECCLAETGTDCVESYWSTNGQ